MSITDESIKELFDLLCEGGHYNTVHVHHPDGLVTVVSDQDKVAEMGVRLRSWAYPSTKARK